ncbi:universal stress protein [Halobaculum sp. P14]|uniref:universal stress protein n=1 Tax=Halobaculum sp. P14 TaxID=3421638 RepID=UPI003EB9306F
MDRGLVVFEDSESHRQLLREAAEHASGSNASLLLLATIDPDDIEEDVEILSSIGEVEHAHYDAETVLSAAADDLGEAARDVLDEFDVPFDSMAVSTDDKAEAIIEMGHEHECDHAFLLGRRRTPTQKAIFGDVTQRVILNYDGYITLATA